MESIAIFTVHKAASTFLYRVMQDVTRNYCIAIYSPNEKKKSGWISDIPNNNAAAFLRGGFETPHFVGPLRRPYKLPDDVSYRKIIHLRDPRDGLVSMFHSFSQTHPGIPEFELKRRQAMGIEQFILSRVDDYFERYLTYTRWLELESNIFLSKYEDMISSPQDWLLHFLRACGVDRDNLRAQICAKHAPDLNPAGAKEGTHKRKMIPGQYLDLEDSLVKFLNEKFGDILIKLDYRG
jgi:hypothetical protein